MAETATVTVKLDPEMAEVLQRVTDLLRSHETRIIDLGAQVAVLRMVVHGSREEPSLCERICALEERNRKDDDYAQEQRDRAERP